MANFEPVADNKDSVTFQDIGFTTIKDKTQILIKPIIKKQFSAFYGAFG
jgi:hypothetical protein